MKSAQSIGTVIQDVLKNLGVVERIGETKISRCWKDIVGEEIDRAAKPVRIEGKKLIVAVKSAVWRQELNFYKKEILDNIYKRVGPGIVKDISFIE